MYRLAVKRYIKIFCYNWIFQSEVGARFGTNFDENSITIHLSKLITSIFQYNCGFNYHIHILHTHLHVCIKSCTKTTTNTLMHTYSYTLIHIHREGKCIKSTHTYTTIQTRYHD